MLWSAYPGSLDMLWSTYPRSLDMLWFTYPKVTDITDWLHKETWGVRLTCWTCPCPWPGSATCWLGRHTCLSHLLVDYVSYLNNLVPDLLYNVPFVTTQPTGRRIGPGTRAGSARKSNTLGFLYNHPLMSANRIIGYLEYPTIRDH